MLHKAISHPTYKNFFASKISNNHAYQRAYGGICSLYLFSCIPTNYISYEFNYKELIENLTGIIVSDVNLFRILEACIILNVDYNFYKEYIKKFDNDNEVYALSETDAMGRIYGKSILYTSVSFINDYDNILAIYDTKFNIVRLDAISHLDNYYIVLK